MKESHWVFGVLSVFFKVNFSQTLLSQVSKVIEKDESHKIEYMNSAFRFALKKFPGPFEYLFVCR